jgi:probable rRNA maturation factor
LRIVDQEEIQQLNADYRGKNQPTNILSFPFDMHNVDLDVPILGDLVICADIIHSESKAQHKSRSAHWAHMIIHGVLHLQGFDHETDEQAEQMEKKEIELLAKFGYDNPYEEHND